MFFDNACFIIGTAYAGKSTMAKELARVHGGIACEENYHDALLDQLDAREFPCVTYTRDLKDWHVFIRRSPQAYKDWIDGAKKECEILELRMLTEICGRGKPVFVDTNISPETLGTIAPATTYWSCWRTRPSPCAGSLSAPTRKSSSSTASFSRKRTRRRPWKTTGRDWS